MEPGKARKPWHLFVGHHRPVSDHESPFDVQWVHSFGARGPRPARKLYSFNSLGEWAAAFDDTNVYRSLCVYADRSGGGSLLGPFLVDIDNADWDDRVNGYSVDLEDALTVARRAVAVLTGRWGIRPSDMKVFFSAGRASTSKCGPLRWGSMVH